MDMLKKIFPHAFKAKDVVSLVVALIIYIVVGGIVGWVIGKLTAIPLIGLVFALLGYVVWAYGMIGIILSVLVFLKLVK